MRRLLALTLAVLPLPAAAQDWCGNVGLAPTEQAICADPILGRLDGELNALYRDARDVAGDGIVAGQRDWLARRDACQGDVFCIERAYDDRIAALREVAVLPPPAAIGPRRPWCTASSLNAAERAICGDDTLANLDAALAAVYGAAQANVADGAQQDWLRRRDDCGADAQCIAAAYLRRITELGARLREG